MKPGLTKRWFEEIIRTRDGLSCGWRGTTVAGTSVWEAMWDHSPLPICTLWLRWTDKERTTMALLNCYVPERMRRLGVLTWTFEQLVAAGDKRSPFTITTEKGTDYSRPWLKKVGFRGSDRTGWVYEVKRPDTRPAAHTA